jgi:hypothetical protein
MPFKTKDTQLVDARYMITPDSFSDFGNPFDDLVDDNFENLEGPQQYPEEVSLDQYIGPEVPSEWTHQTTDFTCAVVSQKMILDAFGVTGGNGLPLSEAALVYEATANGWLTASGTSPSDISRLLELHGIETHQGQGMEGVVQELAHGRKVIVGVDAEELWHSDHPVINDIKDWFGRSPNHALVVEGVRVDDNGQPFVIVNDPGDPDGSGREYPLVDFHDAFDDSGCFFVATNEAPPGLAGDACFGRGFDQNSGTYDGSDSWLSWARDKISNPAVQHALVKGGLAAGAVAFSSSISLGSQERKRLLRAL